METPLDEKFCYICRHVKDWASSMEVCGLLIERKAIGIKKLISISKNEWQDQLHQILENLMVITVHESCYKKYTHPHHATVQKRKRSESEPEAEEDVSIEHLSEDNESNIIEFDWTHKCCICGKSVSMKKSLRGQYREVKTSDVRTTIVESLMHPDSNYDETEKNKILNRISNVPNFETLGALYHVRCFGAIHIPLNFQKDKVNITQKINEAINLIIEYIDNHEHTQFTLQELAEHLPQNIHKPHESTILSRLQQHYGNDLVVASNQKTSTIICVTTKGFYDALNDSWSRQQEDVTDDADREHLRKAAEAIIKEIREHKSDLTTYPQGDTMLNNLYEKIPPKLKFFLDTLILNTQGKKKLSSNYKQIIASTAHVLMSASFPRYYLSPLQLALGVLLHREFGTKNVIEMFHACGLTASYAEVRKYEMSAAKHTEIALQQGTFIQFVWDNCDKNFQNLLGGEFHCAGEIAIITPASGVQPTPPIPRSPNISAKEMEELEKIEIINYGLGPSAGLENIFIKNQNLDVNLKFTDATKISIFWMLRKYLYPELTKGWNGFIENLTEDDNYETSFIQFLPFIHGKPNDFNTLYTAIMKSVSQARNHRMKTCIITFDQQLYWKARDIVAAKFIADDVHVFIRLGGFHTLLSFLGCIGTVMRNSGLHEALSIIYGENIVSRMLIGKQYSRAVRAHTLVVLAVVNKIFAMCRTVDTSFESTLGDLSDQYYEVPEKIEDLLRSSEFKSCVEIFEKNFERIEERNLYK